MDERDDDICPFCGNACGHWAAAKAERDDLRDQVAAVADVLADKEAVSALGDTSAGAPADGVRRLRADWDRLRTIVYDVQQAHARAEKDLLAAEAERDRLRAVVDAARDYLQAWGAAPTQTETSAEVRTMEALHAALKALDRSDDMGGSAER
jgi:hypothetical protein